MSTEETRTLADLTADFVRRVVTYTDELTYFGQNSAGYAIAVATAQQTAQTEAQRRAVLRRHTLLGASGDALTEVAEENGAQRLGGSRAVVLVIVRPWSARVTAITGSMVEVDDSSKFEVGDSIRIVSADGSNTEIAEIFAISTATGPNGGDELDVGLVVNSYSGSTSVLLRRTLTAGTVFTSTSGVSFESLEDVTVGDANPVMLGESASLALADKVLCEAVTRGSDGKIEALTISGLQTPDEDIRAASNPFRGHGGTDEESDFELKFRATHGWQLCAQETSAQLEALARIGNNRVLRAFPEPSDAISTVRIRVLTRAGGGLSASAREALGRFMSQRLRSTYAVEVLNLEATAVEVEADITLTPGSGTPQQRLEATWRKVADRLANYLDWRKWPEEEAVDEAKLLAIVRNTPGVASLQTSTFEPAADIEIAAASLPMLTRLVLRDLSSSASFGADLRTSYGI